MRTQAVDPVAEAGRDLTVARVERAIAVAANEAEAVEQALSASLAAVRGAFDCVGGRAFWVGPSPGLEVSASDIACPSDAGEFDRLLGPSGAASVATVERAVAERGPTWQSAPPGDAAASDRRPRTLAVPVVADGDVVAVIGLLVEAAEQPTRELVGLASFAAAQVGRVFSRRRAEADHARLFTLAADMLGVAGLDGCFRRVNPAFERTLGYTPAELTSRPWLDFVHPDDRAATVAEGQKLSAGALTLNFDNRYRCKDGTYRWLSWTSVPVVREGLIYAVARDVTDRKRAEEQLQAQNRLLAEAARSEREAHATLREAQGRLVQAEKLAALGQLVAGVAHEINNPLAYVTNNLSVLRRDLSQLLELLAMYRSADPVLADRAPDLLRRINDHVDAIDLPAALAELADLVERSGEGLGRIRQIVKDLRDFARHDAIGDLQEGADLNAGVESTLNIARGRASRQQVRIDRDLAPLPPVTCRPAKINQVLLNLLVNAIDACSAGGRVTVRTRAVPGGVDIEVADTGCGIPPEVRDRIFDPFFTTKPQGQGTGLGLSISHGIVQEHGGRIDVESEPGRGTTFTVHLPLSAPTAAAAAPAAKAVAASAAAG